MGFLTKYGSIWGAVPMTGGKVLWVAPSATYTVDGRSYSASDGNDGLSPERALLTLDYAVGLCTANAGDVICLLPGDHSWSASVALDVAGVSVVGMPYRPEVANFVRPKTTITTTATDEIINITAANCSIMNLRVIPVSTVAGIDFSAAADNLHVVDCSFDMATPAVNSGTKGIAATGAASNVLIESCYFECDGAQGAAIAAGAIIDSVIQDCVIVLSAGTWAASVTTAAAVDRLIIRRCGWHAGNATITAAILGTTGGTASAVAVWDCRFPDSATVAVDTFDAGTAELAENYQAGVGATDGGVLVVAIT